MQGVENNNVKSKRQQVAERMQNKYPDKSFADDEALFGQISDDYDQYDQDIAKYKEDESKLAEMYMSDPRSATFLMHWRDGSDPAIELVRQFGTEIKDAIDDPEKQEAIAKANKEFVERVAREKELDKQYQENLAQSLQVVEQYQQENGLTDQQVDDAMQWLIGIVSDGVMGKFSTESIDFAMKAIRHDSDVAIADREGEVRGRNSRIDERLRRNQQSDGMPMLGGKNNMATQDKKGLSFFDYAEAAS